MMISESLRGVRAWLIDRVQRNHPVSEVEFDALCAEIAALADEVAQLERVVVTAVERELDADLVGNVVSIMGDRPLSHLFSDCVASDGPSDTAA